MSAGQAASAVVGGVVGFFVGGPAGAAIGFSIGMAAGGLLDPPKGPSQPGPKINDKNFQTAKYGDMLPRFYGTIPVAGNVTWIENGKLKPTVRKKKSGGKGGGGKASVPAVSYSSTFFLSLGVGRIAGVRRIWCSDKLIYNAGSDDLETIIASNQAATGFRVYLGTDDQLPDPRYEAAVGVGNAPAYRGEAYIAFYDFQLADFGNSLQGAQFKVEVVTEQSATAALVLNTPISHIATPTDRYGTQSAPYMDLVAAQMVAVDITTDTVFNQCVIQTIDCRSTSVALRSGFTKASTPWQAVRGSLAARGIAYAFGAQLYIGSLGFRFRLSSSQPYLMGMVFSNGDDYLAFRVGRGLSVIAPALDPTTGGDFDSETELLADSNAHHAWVDGDKAYVLDSGLTFVKVYAASSLAFIEQIDLNLSTALPAVSAGSWTTQVRLVVKDGQFLLCFLNTVVVCDLDGNELYARVLSLPAEQGAIPLFGVNSCGGLSFASGLLGVFSCETGRWYIYRLAAPSYANVPLSDILEAEVALSSLLTPADLDTSLLTAQVRGYRVSGGSIRSALEPLQGAFPFDIIQSGYQLKCVPRGQAPVMTIPWEDLGASDGDTPGELLKEAREMDTQLPALVSVKYLDAAREYAIAEQSKPRINTQAINRVDRELALVLTADEAAGVAEVLCELPWLERTPASFSLPPPYLALEPADVVTIVAPWATYEVRLTEGNYTPSGRGEWEAKPNRAALYTSNAKGAEGVPPAGTIPLAGESLFIPLDIPVVDETLQDAPGFVGVMTGYTGSWPGGVAMRSADGGQTWSELQAYSAKTTLGVATGTLPASDGTQIDRRTLVVTVLSGELESITRDQMLAGQNYAAYGADGRWEVVRFQNAALQGDGSSLLDGFVRGDRGTEWATGLHQDGDWFVLLDDPDNAFIGMAIGSIGVPASYRGVTSGASLDSASDVPFTYQGVNLECLSPVYARGSRDGAGNFSGTFTRRSRLSSSWWGNGIQAPVGEASEAYEVDVMSGATVKRTILSSSPAFSYSAANQAADFGSAQAAITFRIYQLSAAVGRGLPLEVTL